VIDFHTHPVQVADLFEDDPTLTRAVQDVFGLWMSPQPLRTYELHIEEAGADKAVAVPLDCTSAHGMTVVSNAQIARLMELTDKAIGFASVDPGQVDAADTLKRDVQEYGLRGLKLDPALQQFDVADVDRAFPVYQAAQELGIPLLIDCGLSWAPKGRAELARPLALEPAIHAFPELQIVISHFAWPWVDEAVALALKHRNVHLETSILNSGTPPESLRLALDRIGLDLLDRSLHAQVVFGSDYPRVDPKRVADGVRRLGLRPRLERKIFNDNAVRLLRLEESAA
jgi:predicted TIM-barrel fold metal-dependent hydrolase